MASKLLGQAKAKTLRRAGDAKVDPADITTEDPRRRPASVSASEQASGYAGASDGRHADVEASKHASENAGSSASHLVGRMVSDVAGVEAGSFVDEYASDQAGEEAGVDVGSGADIADGLYASNSASEFAGTSASMPAVGSAGVIAGAGNHDATVSSPRRQVSTGEKAGRNASRKAGKGASGGAGQKAGGGTKKPSRRRGRPAGPERRLLSVRILTAVDDALTRAVEETERGPQDITDEALTEWLTKRGFPPQVSSR